MALLHLILIVLSLVLALVASLWQPQVPPRLHLGWLALAAFVAAALVPR